MDNFLSGIFFPSSIGSIKKFNIFSAFSSLRPVVGKPRISERECN
jgi:hypothetical protein